jgi:uncharacterized damage-inducible protein DinB
MPDPRYPIGPFSPDPSPSPESRARHIEQLAALPAKMRTALRGLKPDQLETPYREGGWTLKQVAHHVPDSHMNAYVRFKLALTENVPTIKPYDEAAWAKLKDAEVTSIEVSLNLLEALHIRWVNLLRAMKAEHFNRKLSHPESGVQTLDRMLALYDWHGNHHLAHITTTRERMKW